MFLKDQKDQLSSEPSVTNFDPHIDFRVFVGINGFTFFYFISHDFCTICFNST